MGGPAKTDISLQKGSLSYRGRKQDRQACTSRCTAQYILFCMYKRLVETERVLTSMAEICSVSRPSSLSDGELLNPTAEDDFAVARFIELDYN